MARRFRQVGEGRHVTHDHAGNVVSVATVIVRGVPTGRKWFGVGNVPGGTRRRQLREAQQDYDRENPVHA